MATPPTYFPFVMEIENIFHRPAMFTLLVQLLLLILQLWLMLFQSWLIAMIFNAETGGICMLFQGIFR